MISIETPRFGKLEVEEDRLFLFPEGLVGLPNLKRFMILDYKDTELQWLQSVDEPDMAFIIVSPFLIAEEYQFELPEAARTLLEIDDLQDVSTYVIIRVDAEKVIANLQGPIVINGRNRKGIQLVLEDTSVNKLNRIVELRRKSD